MKKLEIILSQNALINRQSHKITELYEKCEMHNNAAIDRIKDEAFERGLKASQNELASVRAQLTVTAQVEQVNRLAGDLAAAERENEKLRAEDEDTIAVLVELRAALATAHKRAQEWQDKYERHIAPVKRDFKCDKCGGTEAHEGTQMCFICELPF